MSTHTAAKPQSRAASHYSANVSSLLQRKCACGGSAGLDGACEECRNKRLLRRSAKGVESTTMPPIVHEVLHSPGQPLDSQTRAFMEPRFGHDFSKVRVHTGARAAESAQAINAVAYAVGRDLVFAAGQYMPETREGGELLAHELTHTIQQNTDMPLLPATLETTTPGDSTEKEAQIAANAVMQGQSFAATPGNSLVIARFAPSPKPRVSQPSTPPQQTAQTSQARLNRNIPARGTNPGN